MKISEMIKGLQDFMADFGDIDCYYAVDDEGNAYRPVNYTPSHYYVDEDGEVMQLEDIEYYERDIAEFKSVCIVN